MNWYRRWKARREFKIWSEAYLEQFLRNLEDK